MLTAIPATFSDRRTAQIALTEFRKRYRLALREMSKPLFWRVWIGREFFDFTCRSRARHFANMQRSASVAPRIEVQQ